MAVRSAGGPRDDSAALNDGELMKLRKEDLVKLLRRADMAKVSALVGQQSTIKEVNRTLQVHLQEIRALKEANLRLQGENYELRELCCFLDDDRQKSKKAATEWQRFSRHSVGTLGPEVAAQLERLRELERRQQQLLQTNQDLTDICLMLDKERGHADPRVTAPGTLEVPQGQTMRDLGDGSSLSGDPSTEHLHTGSGDVTPAELHGNEMMYIKFLENKLKQLEGMASFPKHPPGVVAFRPNHKTLPSSKLPNLPDEPQVNAQNGAKLASDPQGSLGRRPAVSQKPEAVVHAMKVPNSPHLDRSLEDYEDGDMSDKEKAVVREMCHVVLKKIGNTARGESPTQKHRGAT
uniref:Coiled-coil domain-containing protein 85C n=1 Tax=Eptatretus burgeri TaxID=7764 RepID=A0A8C4NLJ0_EPTBU